MIFENATALWLLLAVPPLLFGLGLEGWRAKQEIAATFPLVLARQRSKQIEKYILAGVLIALLIAALALPKVAASVSAAPEKSGEIVLLVDVSASMAAQEYPNTPSRLERVKPILYEIIDGMEAAGQVKISLHGFTNVARSHVPFVGIEDYAYLRDSIKKVLGINSTPGEGTSIGQSILDVTGKFTKSEPHKLVILFSDGEPFMGLTRGMTDYEASVIENAIKQAADVGIKVFTVGVGEREGAKVPIFNDTGEFTGEYAKMLDADRMTYRDYVSYLEEKGLEKIASVTGGRYFSEEDRRGLLDLIQANLGSVDSEEQATKQITIYRSIAHWFVLASIPFWVLFVRRHLR